MNRVLPGALTTRVRCGAVFARPAVCAQRLRNICAASTALVQLATEEAVRVNVATESAGLFYDGVVFDMDGTLTQAHIDFADMRARTNIPQGDLFTVMEAWKSDADIKRSMDIILDIEAEAAKGVSMMPGLLPLLQTLKERQVPVALVTRNTTHSVNAFFNLIGEEWKGLFSQVLTREFRFVKPDKRLLLHVADEWGFDPSQLLMVGDSFEDVEVGNAAGTATCWIEGGGNEKPGVKVQTPAGAVATFSVKSLDELRLRLEEAADKPWRQPNVKLGWPAREKQGENVVLDGAPPPGLRFLDWLHEKGQLRSGGCSFPVMGRAAGGLATTDEIGDKVLHVGCGTGGLTKMMASQGMQVVGIDADVSAAQKRGLTAVPYVGKPLSPGSLKHAAEAGPFDCVVIYDQAMPDLAGLAEIQSLLHPHDGRLCCEVSLEELKQNPAAAIVNRMHDAGMTVVAWQTLPGGRSSNGRLRLVAKKH